MKSKKIILGIAVAAILVIGGIALNLSSKDSTTSKNEPATNTETTTDSDTEQAKTEEDSNTTATTEENSNTNAENSNAETANEPSTTSENTAAPADSANVDFASKDAADKIVKFYLGEENVADQKLTPISLENNVAKKQDNSNTFYSDKEEFTDNTSTGLIIILDNYDAASKSYKYTLKDYYSIKDGENLGTGTVTSDGNVTEDE